MSKIVPVINVNNNLTVEKDKVIISTNGNGIPGPPGPKGNGIEKIELTNTSGWVDTYTIYFTNGTTFDYYITNGRDGSGVDLEWYEGPYEVTPSTTFQTLSTSNLAMSTDVEINEIPYYEVTNLSGGNTATIGGN